MLTHEPPLITVPPTASTTIRFTDSVMTAEVSPSSNWVESGIPSSQLSTVLCEEFSSGKLFCEGLSLGKRPSSRSPESHREDLPEHFGAPILVSYSASPLPSGNVEVGYWNDCFRLHILSKRGDAGNAVPVASSPPSKFSCNF